ncbi:MAG: hypothetical protein HY744_27875 [Deltaproteobacteria bacterium]|nr:hypothetical protein [Deltaproteobacteria bacterium]
MKRLRLGYLRLTRIGQRNVDPRWSGLARGRLDGFFPRFLWLRLRAEPHAPSGKGPA